MLYFSFYQKLTSKKEEFFWENVKWMPKAQKKAHSFVFEIYTTQKENLNVTKRVFDNTVEKYKYGHATNVDVTNASTDIITAQANYIQAVLSVVNAQVSLENMLCEE